MDGSTSDRKQLIENTVMHSIQCSSLRVGVTCLRLCIAFVEVLFLFYFLSQNVREIIRREEHLVGRIF